MQNVIQLHIYTKFNKENPLNNFDVLYFVGNTFNERISFNNESHFKLINISFKFVFSLCIVCTFS